MIHRLYSFAKLRERVLFEGGQPINEMEINVRRKVGDNGGMNVT